MEAEAEGGSAAAGQRPASGSHTVTIAVPPERTTGRSESVASEAPAGSRKSSRPRAISGASSQSGGDAAMMSMSTARGALSSAAPSMRNLTTLTTGVVGKVATLKSMGNLRSRDMYSQASTARKASGPAWRLTEQGLRDILEVTEASQEQKEFLEVFIDAVMRDQLRDDELMVSQEERPDKGLSGHYLVVSTDLRRLQLNIKMTDWEQCKDLATSFLTECGLPEEQHCEALTQVVDLDIAAPDTTHLWCRLDRMGLHSPTIDAGFSMEWSTQKRPAQWSVLDLLLPPSDDKDSFLDCAMSEQSNVAAAVFSCSLFPTEPEKAIHLKLHSSRSSPLTGLLFFRALDFEEPEESVMQAIVTAKQKEVMVSACFGPKGLTRVALRLGGAEAKVASTLAKSLHYPFRRQDLAKVHSALSAKGHYLLEYAAAGDRYTVAVGFQDSS